MAESEMSVTFLGTASAYPTPKRFASSIIFKYGTDLWMFDCGESTQVQLMKSDHKASRISKIFITHLHGDHCYGLPGLLCTMSQNNQRLEPISIYGPVGLAKYLRTSLGLSRSQLAFKYKVSELVPTADMYQPDDRILCNIDPKSEYPNICEEPSEEIQCDTNGVWNILEGHLSVQAGKLEHSVPSFGFVIKENPAPGKLNVEQLAVYGIKPGPSCSLLKAGKCITAPNGTIVNPADVLYPPTPGRKVVICGDSSNTMAITGIAEEADIFIHEATLQNSLVEKAIERGHSTPKMAAEFALAARAVKLCITHFSQRYTESSHKKPTEPGINLLLKEAIEIFGDKVIAAEDLLTIDIPLRTVKHKTAETVELKLVSDEPMLTTLSV